MSNINNKSVIFKDTSLENIFNDLHREFDILLDSSFNNDNGSQKLQQETKCLYLLKKYIDAINTSQIFPTHFLKIQFAKRYNFENKEPLGVFDYGF